MAVGLTFGMGDELILAVVLQWQVIVPHIPVQLLHIAPFVIPRLIQQRSPQFGREAQLASPHQLLLLLIERKASLDHECLLNNLIIRPDLVAGVFDDVIPCPVSKVGHQK